MYGDAVAKANFNATIGVSGSESQKGKKAKTGSASPAANGAGGADSKKKDDTSQPAPDDTKTDTSDSGSDPKDKADQSGKPKGSVEVSEEQKLQDSLRTAFEQGKPAVVVFGSRSAKDTEKLLSTLDKNMKDGKADYIFADTDKLDPNSELGKVARRSEEKGLGLGADGKSDLAFTGIYKVEKGEDGQYHLGNSVATFWGGRPEIAGIMNDQLRYATRTVPGGGAQPADGVKPAPAADSSRQPADGSTPGQNGESVKSRKDADERAAKEKADREARVKELTNLPYTLDKFAAGWGSFIDAHGMKDAGAVRDLTNEFGQQVLKGEFDGKKLAGMMDNVKLNNGQDAAAMLGQVNDKLSQSGLTVKATVKDGKINEMSISEVQAGEGAVSVAVDQNGNVTAYQGLGKGKQANLDQVSLRIAKKAAADACP